MAVYSVDECSTKKHFQLTCMLEVFLTKCFKSECISQPVLSGLEEQSEPCHNDTELATQTVMFFCL